MPHCVIEYTKDCLKTANVDDLIKAVFDGAMASDLFDQSHIKVRAKGYDDFFCGSGDHGQCHVTLRILAGRTAQQKNSLSQLVLSKLKPLMPHIANISVEVKDLERDSYVKKSF